MKWPVMDSQTPPKWPFLMFLSGTGILFHFRQNSCGQNAAISEKCDFFIQMPSVALRFQTELAQYSS